MLNNEQLDYLDDWHGEPEALGKWWIHVEFEDKDGLKEAFPGKLRWLKERKAWYVEGPYTDARDIQNKSAMLAYARKRTKRLSVPA